MTKRFSVNEELLLNDPSSASRRTGATIATATLAPGSLQRMVTGVEFIRRFLQHVVPSGFKRVRDFGWLSPAAHKRLARIRALLDWEPPQAPEPARETKLLCPRCQHPLQHTASWRRGEIPPPLFQLAWALFPRPPGSPQRSVPGAS
jgi:hypothetical protein